MAKDTLDSDCFRALVAARVDKFSDCHLNDINYLYGLFFRL